MRVIDLATLSLTGGPGIAEAKQPIWFADGSGAGVATTTAGTYFLVDGGALVSGDSSSSTKLFTLSSTWQGTTNFAFEVSMNLSAAGTCYAELWDITAGTSVSGSQVSTTSTTATVVRSGKTTLTPSHTYGITIWASANTVYIQDASLIVFPS